MLLFFDHSDIADIQARVGEISPLWFVAHAEGRSEFAIVEALAESAIEAWCPAQTIWRRSPRRKEAVRAPLLPGYVFAALLPDIHGDLPFPLVLAVDGVIGFLGSGQPRAIRYGEPDPQFQVADRKVKGQQAARRPRTLWEIRALEAAGVFDYTRNSEAAKSAKRAKVTLHSFVELASALDEKAAA